VDASRHFGRLALAAGNEIGLVARVVVGPEARIGSGELASFEQAAALFEVSEAAMTAEAPRSVEAAWQSVRASEAVRAYERLRPTLPPAPAEGVTNYGDARALGAAIERALAVASFGRTLVASVEGAADAMRDQALGRAHRLQLAVGALTLVSVGVALLALRALVRPLHQLARHAHRVSAGDLGAEAPALRGPAEIVVVRDAVEDLVMALRLIDAQAGALASGELRDPVLDEEVPGRIGDSLNRSVGRLSEVTAQLTHAATHDSLTGLANRAGALAVLDELAVTGRTDGQRKALLFIDLDGFKAVNDRHGHEVGDQLLRTVADRLAAAVRSHDLVARLGGDEFLVLTDAAGSVETAERLIASVARPAHHEVGELRVTASVGVAVAEPGLAPAELLRRADAAVYRAKARGKGCVVVHLAEASPDRPAHALRCTDTA
jgi:diguanylate cyclase (GGDEF)-like protein